MFDRLLHNCRYVIVNFLELIIVTKIDCLEIAKLHRMIKRILFLETALFYRSVRRVYNNARLNKRVIP